MATGTAFTHFSAAAVLNCYLNATNITAPANIYMALFTVMPGEDGTGGTEVSGGGYARQAMSFGAPSGSPRQCATDALIDFGTPSANYGTLVGWGIYDASTAGNLIFKDAFTPNITVNSGQPFSIASGALTMQID